MAFIFGPYAKGREISESDFYPWIERVGIVAQKDKMSKSTTFL